MLGIRVLFSIEKAFYKDVCSPPSKKKTFGLVSLFDDKSTFVGYLMQKPSFKKNSCDTV